jgi:hypothetical protein
MEDENKAVSEESVSKKPRRKRTQMDKMVELRDATEKDLSKARAKRLASERLTDQLRSEELQLEASLADLRRMTGWQPEQKDDLLPGYLSDGTYVATPEEGPG